MKETDVVNRLMRAEQQKQENLRQKQIEQYEADMKECSFAPKIDEKSEKLENSQNILGEVFQLFVDVKTLAFDEY